MTEQEKIQKALQAYQAYTKLMEQLTTEQKQTLNTTIAQIEQAKVNQIRQTIAQL